VNWVLRAANTTLIYIEQLDSANGPNKPWGDENHSSLLLLDESMSVHDAPSGRKVFGRLAQHFPNQTIVFISHRISAVKWLDRIVVMNQGAVEDQGTHEQLIGSSGLYSCLQGAVTPALYTQTRYPSSR